MSITPTSGTQAPYRSGRCVMHAPTSRPPFEPPLIASRPVRVQPVPISHSAQAMKSSNTFCLLSRRPASYHSLPYSPPPRRFETASRPPSSSQASQLTEQVGVIETSNPPYPQSSVGTSPDCTRPDLCTRNIGTRVPSLLVANTCSVSYPSSASDGSTSVSVRPVPIS